MSALATLKVALAAGTTIETEAAREAERKTALLADADRSEADIRALDAAMADREGDALAAGLLLPEVPLAERRQREKLERGARAARVAAGKIAARLEGEVAERQRQAEAVVIDTALGASRTIRNAGQAAVKAGLDDLASHLGEMAAAQRLRGRFAGLTFNFDGERHPPGELWDGGAVVRRFIEALPPRLLPEGFAERVEAAAVERLAEYLTELEPSG